MKKLFYLVAVAACFLLYSCSSSALKPTGDPEKDAKALVEYQVKATKDASDALMSLKLSKASKIGEEMKKVGEAFTKYYEKKPELKAKFDAAVANLNSEFENGINEIGEGIADKLGGLFGEENTETTE